MAVNSQLIKKNKTSGGYNNVFPKTFIDAIKDRETGQTLGDILNGFNMYFLSYVGSREQTRLQVPSSLRRTGLWITYVMYDKTIIIEWFASDDISDDSFKLDSNWRVGNNALVGDITISSEGNWVINGVDSGIKAQGEQGITPILRIYDNKLQVSYTNGASFINVADNPVYTQFRINNNKLQVSTDLGNNWSTCSDYIAAWFKWVDTGNGVGKIQISRDNSSWSDLSPEFTNNLKIADYVSSVGELPSGVALGTIYGVGPTYDSSDTSHTNPIYTLYVYTSDGWLNNGHFTSIAAGIVQTIGDNENVVMSQKAVTKTINRIDATSGYVTCTTEASTVAKTVAKTNFALSTGCRLIIKMDKANTAASPTLNVNNTGAKPLYYNGEIASADNTWEAGEVLDVYYDGTNYQANNMQGSAGGNMILSWNTDVTTTRKSVKQNKRKAGLIIAYNHPDNGWINEQYIGSSLTDTNWGNDANWEQLASSQRVDNLENIVGSSQENEDVTELFSFTNGGYISSKYDEGLKLPMGGVGTSEKYAYSDYVEIPDTVYEISIKCLHLKIDSIAGLCFYDYNKKAIQGYAFNGSSGNSGNLEIETIKVLPSYRYLRTTIGISDRNNFSCLLVFATGLLKDVSALKKELENADNKISSIDSKTTQLEKEIGFISEESENLTSLFSWTDGGAISGIPGSGYSLGDIIPTPSYAYSNYVEIDKYDSLDITCVTNVVSLNSQAGLCFYDSGKKSIKGHVFTGLTGLTLQKIEVPSNAKYIRTTVFKDSKTDFYCRKTADAGILGDINTLKKAVINSIQTLNLESPDGVIATAWNYILKKETIEETEYLSYSKDLGKNWTRQENIYGDIVYVHFFSNGHILFASMSKCYYSEDFTQINESSVYDYDGSSFIPTAQEHFFQNDQSRNEMMLTPSGKEYVMWGDYAIDDPAYIPRVWYSEDYGKTVKCILKFGTTIIEGKTYSVRHVHGALYNRFDNNVYIFTGDSGNECMLIKGSYSDSDMWIFEVLGIGDRYKFGDIIFKSEFAYFVTDYTVSGYKKGILRCPYHGFKNIDNYQYIAQVDNYAGSLITFLADNNGNKLLFPDLNGRGKCWYCREEFKFKEIPLSEQVVLTNVGSPNYSGDIYVRKSLSTYPFKLDPMINLTKSMRNSGCPDFFIQDNVFKD